MIKNEWKSLLRNKLMLIVVIAIIVIPIIYAGLFLKSMWDPYGNVDSLPVAVVNEDKPVEYNGKTLSIGKDMTDELKDNDSMAFNIVDSKTAEDGLANGTYYMVIKIPENFSANAATVMDNDPKQMELSYETNPGTNYIASKLSETAMLKLRDNIASKVTETYTETVFDSISEAGDGMQEAADGSGKIEDGLNTAADGNKTITKNLKKLSTSTLTFVSGADSLTEGLKTYTDGVAKVNDGAKSLDDGADQLNSGVATLTEKVPELTTGVDTLDKGVQQYTAGVDELNKNSDALKSGASSLESGAAPRYLGSRDAWILIHPNLGISRMLFGMICPNAATMMMSGARFFSSSTNSGSLTFTGCSTGIPCFSASSFTGVGIIVLPLPFGLSGCVITASTSYPFSASATRGATAKSGVPI